MFSWTKKNDPLSLSLSSRSVRAGPHALLQHRRGAEEGAALRDLRAGPSGVRASRRGLLASCEDMTWRGELVLIRYIPEVFGVWVG